MMKNSTYTHTHRAERERERERKAEEGDGESRREKKLRKYFMLFKCVLYYILTAINFIR